MTSESEILEWLFRNFPKNSSKSKYYIEHDEGSMLFIVRSARENSKIIKELNRKKKAIDLQIVVGVLLHFNLDEIDELEIENYFAKSIKFFLHRNLTDGVFILLTTQVVQTHL